VAPGALVHIYQLAREFEWWCWLCPKHLRARLDDNWQRKVHRTPPFDGLPCEDRDVSPCG
jgi:hypothetical protein